MSLNKVTLENLQRLVSNMEQKYGKKGEIAMSDLATALQNVITGKADAATTLQGYGITDAMTATQIENAISGAISSTYKPGGSIAPTDVTAAKLVEANEGRVYDLSAKLTITDEIKALFVEGVEASYPKGTNIVVIDTDETGENPSYKFDVLAGFIDLSGYSTTEEMNSAISAAVAGKITLTDISAPAATGTGNVVTGITYDSSTGEIKSEKGITALTEADFVAYTDAEIDGLWNNE